MNKISILMMCFLILMPFALANPTFSNWCNGGYQYSGFYFSPLGLCSSNSRENTMPDDHVNASFENYRIPIVTNLDKSVSLGKENEIYMFSTSEIGIFDTSFSQIGSYIMTGANGTVAIVDYPNSNKYYLAYISLTGTNYSLKLLNRTGSSFSLVKTIDITDKNYTGDIKGGKTISAGEQSYAYITDASMNITRINLLDGTETSYPFFSVNSTKCSFTFSPIFNSPMETNDYDLDGYDDVLVAAKDINNVNKMYVGVLSTATGTWITQKTQAIASTEGCSVGAGKVGSSGTSYKIMLFRKGSAASAGIYIYSLSGATLYSDTSVYEVLYPIFGDIDRDGRNEFIYADDGGTTVKVYDDTFTNIYNFNSIVLTGSTRSASDKMTFMNLGGFTDVGDFQNILAPMQIWVINSSHTGFTAAYNYNGSAADSFMSIPVSIVNQNQDDILLVSDGSGQNMAFLTGANFAECGNSICEGTETILTCPEDCSPTTANAALLTSVEVNPCNTQIWKQNTTVTVTAIAQNIGADNVNIYASFAPDAPSAYGCNQTAKIENIASGSLATFNFIANCTGTSNILMSANTVSNSELNYLSFSFDVAADGIEHGDSSCGVTQPLSAIIPDANLTGNATNNGLYTGVAYFAGLTGLSGIIIWLIFMLVMIISILVICVNAHVPHMITFGIIIFTSILATVIGSFLKILPVSFVVIIALTLVVIIGLWFRGLVTGSSQGG